MDWQRPTLSGKWMELVDTIIRRRKYFSMLTRNKWVGGKFREIEHRV